MLTTLQRNLRWTISQAASLICLTEGMMINAKQVLPIIEVPALSNSNLLTFAYCYDIMIKKTQNKAILRFVPANDIVYMQ